MPGGFAVDGDGVKFSAARHAGQEHFSWIDVEEVREWKVNVEAITLASSSILPIFTAHQHARTCSR